MKKIYFFAPDLRDRSIPESKEEFWSWLVSTDGLSGMWGVYHWVLQSYLYLKDSGLDVSLVFEVPDDGIIVTHRDYIPEGFRPGRQQFLVCLLVDREKPFPYANLHVIHNPVARLRLAIPSVYMPPWPQISLIPRADERASKLNRIGYFGYPENSVIKLTSGPLGDFLAERKIEVFCPEPAGWNDFSTIDAVLAVRSIGTQEAHLNKPNLKLINAWLAGVPAVLGFESAYRATGTPGKDYLEATELESAIAALDLLHSDPSVFRSIAEAGRATVQMFTPEATCRSWISLFRRVVFPAYEDWCGSLAAQIAHSVKGRVVEGLSWRCEMILPN